MYDQFFLETNGRQRVYKRVFFLGFYRLHGIERDKTSFVFHPISQFWLTSYRDFLSNTINYTAT